MRALLCVGVFFALAIPGTTAAWVDPVTVTGTTLRAGTADLKVNGSDAPSFTAINASKMDLGDSTAGVLTVRNAGDVPLGYYATASATNNDGKNLAGALTVKVTADAGTSGAAPNVTCAGSALGATGTSLTGNLVGSASNRRDLAAGTSETLCVQVNLPAGATIRGGTTNVTLTFTAITGTTADPGWSDTVQTSGTTLAMMPSLTFGATGPVASRTSSGTATVQYPAGTQSGDLVLLVEANAANQNISTPTGWTQLADQQATSPQARFTVWWRVAGNETSVAVSVNTNSSGAQLWAVRYATPSGATAPTTAHTVVQEGVVAAAATLTPAPDATVIKRATIVISLAAIRAPNVLSLDTARGFAFGASSSGSTGVGSSLGVADLRVANGATPASPTWTQTGTAAPWAWTTVAFSTPTP